MCIRDSGSVYLSEAERNSLNKLSGDKKGRSILHPYRAYAAPTEEGKAHGPLLGTAWFDTHRVRTLRETIMIVVDPSDKVKRIEVLAFAEPKGYLPKPKWFAQFVGKSLNPGLKLARDIRGVSGVSMSCRAATSAVRRCLASHQISAEQVARQAREAAAKKAKRSTAKKSPTTQGSTK